MKIDDGRVRAAILEAERGTGAAIAVHVARHHIDDALDHARRTFHEKNMHEHPAGNAVLFVVAPRSRKVAVYGGAAIHERAGDAFWKGLIDEMTPLFAQNRPTEALVRAIELLGSELRARSASEPVQ